MRERLTRTEAGSIARARILWPVLLLVAGVAGLLVAFQMRPPVVVRVGEAASEPLLKNFHAPEATGGRAYRWTRAEASVRLPEVGLPAPWELVLYLSGQPDRTIPLFLAVDGDEVGRLDIASRSGVYSLVLSGKSSPFAHSVELELRTSAFSPPNDPRELGVAVERVELRAVGHGPRGIALGPSLLFLGLSLLSYAGFARLSGSRLGGLVAGGMVLGFACVGVQRYWPTQQFRPFPWAAVIGSVSLAGLVYGPAVRRDLAAMSRTMAAGRLALPRARTIATSRGWLWAMAAGACLVLGLHLAAPWLPVEQGPYENLSWGVRFYGRLPVGWRWGGVLAAAAVCLGSGPLARALLGLSFRTRHYRVRSALVAAALAALLAIACFWLLRTRCFYGDWEEIVEDIALGALWRERSPVDFLLRAGLGRALAAQWPAWLRVAPPLSRCLVQPVAATDAFPALRGALGVLSCIVGGVFVAGASGLGAALFPQRLERSFFVLLLVAQGTALLFAGYIEMYTMVTAALAVFLLSGVLALQRRIGYVWSVWAFALAVVTHLQAVYLAPALLYVVWNAVAEGRRARIRAVLGAVLAGLLLLALVSGIFLLLGYDPGRLTWASRGLGGVDGVFLKHLLRPAPEAHEPYPILSWEHLRAVLNQQLLAAPLSLFALVATVAAFGRRWRALLADRILVFLLLATVPALLFTWVYNPDLGARQDWDLLAPPFVLLTATAAYLILGRVRPAGARLSGAIVWLSVSLLHTLSWLWLNHLGL